MSNLAIEGLISGFKTTDLINAILDVQVRAPVKSIQDNIDKETTKLTQLQAVSANLLSFSISAQGLGSSSLFSGKQVTSSDTTTVNASASGSASAGSFSVQVNNLARADQVSSNYYTSATDDLNLTGKFIINGKTVSLTATDTLSTLATQINAANAGVKATVVQSAPNQNKLVLNATSTGVDKIEMRQVGTTGVLSSLGLLDTAVTGYNYSVNANTTGAVSNLQDPTTTFGANGNTFSVTDAGGQNKLTVTLTGARTLSQLASDITAAATAQGANISASVVTEGTKQRLQITSSTGIPTKFEDPDNVLFGIGMVSGIQSAAFSSTTRSIRDQLNIGVVLPSTVQISDGDGSNTISVSVNMNTDTLSGLAKKINDAAAATPGSTLSAQVITVNGVSRLELQSASGRPIFTSDPDNVFKTLGLVNNGFKNYDQQGENSQITYNGVTVNRSSNVISDLVTGVSLALLKENTNPVTISVSEDHSNVPTSVQNFVSAYNNLATFLKQQTAFDPNGKNNGPLFGNATVRGLKSSLAGMLSRVVPDLPSVKVSDLNNGNGIDLGKINITDRLGHSGTVDLSAVSTVQDLIDSINSDNSVNSVKVRAEANSAGTSINLIDESGGAGIFKVEESGGTTAADLGLLGQTYGNQIAGKTIYQGGAKSLASIGISLGTDGSLTFDSAKLQSMLNDDPDGVKNLLTAGKVGIGAQFTTLLQQYTAYSTGIMDTATQGIQNKIDQYNKQVARYNDRATAMEATLQKQFTALEVSLSQSQQVSQFLTQKLSASSG